MGPARATIVLVGETPGDQEDRAGKPFVGPAGRLLDESLAAAGLSRGDVYLTNAVKHFKWEARGKRRLHARPSSREIKACQPWLEAELDAVRPRTIVCLGATAAQVLLGRSFRVTRQRGVLLPSNWAKWIVATHHPAAVLRSPDEAARRARREELAADLRLAASSLQG
jgi:DNA polymerase